MNYRHAYHAGNFADVVKHIILTRVIAYLQRKEAGLLMLDTHAGLGRYELASTEAQKTGEAETGIKQFFGAADGTAPEADKLLCEYSEVVDALNFNDVINVAPGSPEIMARLRRAQDRCIFNELHPTDHATLAANYLREKKTEISLQDAWEVLRAKLPPAERRGLILIDPPFEKKSEVDDLLTGLDQALKRFSTGTYLVWYPLKDARMCKQLRYGIAEMPVAGALDSQLLVQEPEDGTFYGSGMVVLNPPYVLHDELRQLLPILAGRLARRDHRGNWATDWLIEPK